MQWLWYLWPVESAHRGPPEVGTTPSPEAPSPEAPSLGDPGAPARRFAFVALAAACVAATAAVSGGEQPAHTELAEPGAALRYEVPCPPGQLPDDGICVPAAAPGLLLEGVDVAQPGEAMAPLRGDRPRDLRAYALPVVLEGDSTPRVEETPTTDPGPASRIAQDPVVGSPLGPALRVAAPGASVRSLVLEAQEGPTEVVFATHGPPGIVITAHTVRRERGLQTLLLVHGQLAEIEPPLLEAMPTAPIPVEADAKLGLTSAAGLLLALRQVRGDVTLQEAVPDLAPEAVFASDPRNALPLLP